MNAATVVSVGSFVIAAALAYLNLRRYWRDKHDAQRASLEKEFKAPAERDLIIVGGAGQAVAVLREALSSVHEESNRYRLERDEANRRIAALEETVMKLEASIRQLEAELRRVAGPGASA